MLNKFSKLVCLIIICSVIVGAVPADSQTSVSREYQIRAAYLFNFIKFVSWPEDKPMVGPNDHIILGIVGDDRLGEALDLLNGRVVRGKKLVIKRIDKRNDLANCHVLYISSSKKEKLPKLFENLKKSSVLTVGEMQEFAKLGGMINFLTYKNKLRYEINLDAAKRSGLKISSALLRLARNVINER